MKKMNIKKRINIRNIRGLQVNPVKRIIRDFLISTFKLRNGGQKK